MSWNWTAEAPLFHGCADIRTGFPGRRRALLGWTAEGGCPHISLSGRDYLKSGFLCLVRGEIKIPILSRKKRETRMGHPPHGWHLIQISAPNHDWEHGSVLPRRK